MSLLFVPQFAAILLLVFVTEVVVVVLGYIYRAKVGAVSLNTITIKKGEYICEIVNCKYHIKYVGKIVSAALYLID